jgi:type IV pilus assembly protein PilC
MPLYNYKAMDAQGQIVTGTMDAFNEQDLLRKLHGMALDLVRMHEVKPHRFYGRGRITRRDLIGFTVHLQQLLQAGISVMEGLEDIRENTKNPMFRGVIASIISDIEGGMTLSEALRQHPSLFDKVFVSLVKAGEESGRLSEVFQNISDSLKWQDEIVSQTVRAILYPSFVLVVVSGVVAFMMIYLVPQLVRFITSLGNEIPLHTRALIATSNAFVEYWYLIFGLPVLLVFLHVRLARRSPAYRLWTDRYLLKIPVVGTILEKIALGRFANYFALTYRSGVSVIAGLELCEEVVSNSWIARGIRQARNHLVDGDSISKAFEKVGLFPVLVLRMLRVGESTGALDEALQNVSYFYERDVRESIERMQTMIEPTLTVVLGLILGWVMLSVLGPVYDSISRIMLG